MVRVSRIPEPDPPRRGDKMPDRPEPQVPTPRLAPYLAVPALIAVSYLAAANLFGWQRSGDAPPLAGTAARSVLDAGAIAEAAALISVVAGRTTNTHLVVADHAWTDEGVR